MPRMRLLSCQMHPAHTLSQANVVSELLFYFCDFHWQSRVIARTLIITFYVFISPDHRLMDIF